MGLIAPSVRASPPWHGTINKKPWDYQYTVMIPHLNTSEILPVVVGLLRHQAVRPYIMIIDTGSSETHCRQLESLREEDCEIHFLRSHSWRNSSGPVAAAMDVSFALCQTEFLFATHADVFLKRREFCQELLDICSNEKPVVGYQMSPREVCDDWKFMASHTATMYHMPRLLSIGACWNLERSHHQFNVDRSYNTPGNWPDTETTFGYCLMEAGIQPHFIGTETNFERHNDANLDHVRSYVGSKLYDRAYHRNARVWMDSAISEARTRLAEWEGES